MKNKYDENLICNMNKILYFLTSFKKYQHYTNNYLINLIFIISFSTFKRQKNFIECYNYMNYFTNT